MRITKYELKEKQSMFSRRLKDTSEQYVPVVKKVRELLTENEWNDLSKSILLQGRIIQLEELIMKG